ncbi:tetratricopeptide repeat protein [Paenactinomyces guangxiensis]|uniref:tetratricopeptide repeat protein n=1 Tax=Paenactinomyces guangxiensis TaxID=1490290 RepID=UPI002FC30C75
MYYLLSSNQNEQAFQLLSEVWPLIPQINNHQVVLELYKYRVILLRKGKNYQKAIECCKEGIQVGYRRKSLTRTIDLLLLLGSIHLRKQEFDKANHCFQMALSLDKNFDFPRRHIDTFTYFGLLCTKQGKWQEADEFLKRAIEKGRQIKDIFRLTKALIAKGNCYVGQQQYEKAAPYYQEAADLVQQNDHKSLQFIALFKLGEFFDSLGKEEEFNHCTRRLFFLQHEMKLEDEDDFYDIL